MYSNESICDGYLLKDGLKRVFANMKHAKLAADRIAMDGLNAYAIQSRISNRFLVLVK